MTRNDIVAKWAADRAEKYRDCLSLVVTYGSYVNGTSNEKSDIDFFFVPNGTDNRVYELCKTFIIDGIGYDLWPLHWDRLEGLSDIKEVVLPFLGDGEILFAATDADRERYYALREKMKKNLSDKDYMRERAIEQLRFGEGVLAAMEKLSGLATLRMFGGRVMLSLADAIAFENGSYYTRGLKKQPEDLTAMNRPDGFIELYEGIMEATGDEALKDICRRAAELVRAFLSAPKIDIEASELPESIEKPSARELAEMYGELVSTFNKIYYCAKTENYQLAFISAVCLQESLSLDFGISEDFLAAYDRSNLRALEKAVREAEQRLLRAIDEGGETPPYYESAEAFVRDCG